MKKFLIFLVSIVVVVCIGLTTYYFVRNNEIITIKTKEIYCNAGDVIPLKSLGIKIEKANVSKKTTFNYNAGGDEVTKMIKYDEATKSFLVSAQEGGDVTLVIRTSNKKYADFTINVHIGNGSVENPYYIFKESDLNKIGDTYRLDKNYILMNDISLTTSFSPIGYNKVTSTWDGFNGVFNGNGKVISNLTLVNVTAPTAGLFTSINSSGKVENLIIDRATIYGSHDNVGVLAGSISGSAEKIMVKNAVVTNDKNNSNIGAICGSLGSKPLRLSYAENVALNVGTASSGINSTVGGIVGYAKESTIQACYTNDVRIFNSNAYVTAGGFVGEFQIGTKTGSIQQSYANTTCNTSGYGAFIGTISKASGFDAKNANLLTYLIGNLAVVGKDSFADVDIVNHYDNTFFKNAAFPANPVFCDEAAALYFIKGYKTAGEIIAENNLVYYAIDPTNIVNWDTTYVWNVENNALPTLRMGNIYPAAPSSEYLNRNLEQKEVENETVVEDVFASDINNESIKLLENVELAADWKPITVTNSIIDGNNKTIYVTLNNAVNNSLGLFSKIDNSTIKNLNIKINGVGANATYFGGLAGLITSSNGLSASTIENVNITFEKGLSSVVFENAGSIAGKMENAIIKNCVVHGFYVSDTAVIKNVGGLVGVNYGQINNCTINAILYANEFMGGVAAKNYGIITRVDGNVSLNYYKATNTGYIGGIAGWNKANIQDSEMKVIGTISASKNITFVGGVVGQNEGDISSVKVTGTKISVADIDGKIYLAGVAAANYGKIEDVNNQIVNLGTVNVDRNQYVAGVVAVNHGTIKTVLTQSNLYGNYVAGVVYAINKPNASVDQVAVGKYNGSTLSQNELSGDKYIAGVIVEFHKGNITNVQASSNLVGKTNETRSSLVALIFPYGATLKNATIDSSLTGYGITYRETWTDFASYNNKAEFGYKDGETGDERFNLYKYDTHHGCMQSVVINIERAGASKAKAAMGTAFAWGKDYQDTADSSFIKAVAGFNDVSQFQGSYTFVCSISTLLNIKHKATRTLTFEIGRYWESNNGISLIFLKRV